MCVFCRTTPIVDDVNGLCLPCTVEQAKDRAEEDELRRQEAWFKHLRRLPEGRGNLFREEDKS